MKSKEINCVCTKCHAQVVVQMKRTLLGFKKFSCPQCEKLVLYPLSVGYRILSLIVLAFLIFTNFAVYNQLTNYDMRALAKGGKVYNFTLVDAISANWLFNLGAILIVFALGKDFFLWEKVKLTLKKQS